MVVNWTENFSASSSNLLSSVMEISTHMVAVTSELDGNVIELDDMVL